MIPANPDALADSLRKSLAMAASDPGNVVQADGTKVGYKGDRCMGGWIADAIIAGPLAPILAALQRVTAERDEALIVAHTMREGVRDAADEATYHRNNCLIAQREKAAAEARAAQLQAEVEAKDRAILLLLPFVDYAAGEGLMFVETDDGEHPEMDAADIMAAVAEALGLELGSDAYLSLLPKGYFAIRTALAARAATAREGQTHTPASGALKIEEADRG